MRDPAVPNSAVVTGGTGFVGSRLVKTLIDGGCRVLMIARGTSQSLAFEPHERLTRHTHDGRHENLSRAIADARPDVVFHLASLYLTQHTPEQVEPLINANLLFGAQLLEACVHAGNPPLVNTGTSWQHHENELFHPVNLYAATKQAFQDLMVYYVRAQGLKALTLELFDTYGPGDPRPKLLNLLRQIAMDGRTLAMSPGEQRLDLVHIDDVIRAYLVAAERLANGADPSATTYAIRSGEPRSLREIVAEFERAAGRPIRIEWGRRPYRPREVMAPATLVPTLPGWSPRLGLAEGLRGLMA